METIEVFKTLLNFIQPSFEKFLFEHIDFGKAEIEVAQRYHFPQLQVEIDYYYGLTLLSLTWI